MSVRIKYVQPEVCPQSYKSILGQRPIWDWRHDKLLWVDIYENKIIESDQNNSQEKHYIVSEGVTNIFFHNFFYFTLIDIIKFSDMTEVSLIIPR